MTRCRYVKVCSFFDNRSEVCTKDAGNYYGSGRKCGQFRHREEMMKNENQ